MKRYCPYVGTGMDLRCDKVAECEGELLCAVAVRFEEQFCEEAREAQEEEERMLKLDGCWYDRDDLKPSSGGKDCLANGGHEGIECQCDECDWMTLCFTRDGEPT